jgi:hypothetical protein
MQYLDLFCVFRVFRGLTAIFKMNDYPRIAQDFRSCNELMNEVARLKKQTNHCTHEEKTVSMPKNG